MRRKYILALDQGTTSSRALIIDHSGKLTGIAQKEFKQYFPQPGWVEHDPEEIWSSQAAVMSEAIARAGISPNEILGIGITNQRETTIVWERNSGKAICPAIVWQDRRTSEFCTTLMNEGRSELVRSKTGLIIDAYFSATKIRWILEHIEGAREKAEKGNLCFGTVDSWLIWKLSRGARHVTDATNASRTMLYNIHTGQWDEELLDLLGVPRSMLPEVLDSSGLFAETSGDVTGYNIPITGVAGDQQAALFGQLCLEKGMAKNTYGTGCFMVMNTGDTPVVSENNLLTTVAWQLGGKLTYALEGSIFVAGAVVQWLRDELGLITNASQSEELARTVDDTAGVVLVPALTGLGAPHWDQYARGTIIGLTLGALAMVMDYTMYNPLGWLAPLYILAVPIIDTMYVIVLRLLAGRKVYYGSPDHFPLRVRRRLDGWTAGTVVVSYAVAVIFGALGLVVLVLDPVSTVILTGVVGAVVIALLAWLAMVPMEG